MGVLVNLYVFGVASLIIFANILNQYACFHHHPHSGLSSLKLNIIGVAGINGFTQKTGLECR
jgi:hypothetical protein